MSRRTWSLLSLLVLCATLTVLVLVVKYQPSVSSWQRAVQGIATQGMAQEGETLAPGDAVIEGDPSDNGIPQPEIDNSSVRLPAWSPWPAGTSYATTATAPQPGETIRVGQCTIAFTFSDSAGVTYGATASHCGKPGDIVWATDANRMADFSAPVGEFIYSDLYSDAPSGIDVGVIRIDDPSRAVWTPDVETPAAVATAATTLGDSICKYGSTTGLTCGAPSYGLHNEILTDREGSRLETVSATATVCARMGDSGGPVFTDVDGQQVVVGIVSGTRVDVPDDEGSEDGSDELAPAPDPAEAATGECLPDDTSMTMSYATMGDVQGILDEVVPDIVYQ